MLDRNAQLCLHERLLGGDRVASAEIFQAIIEPLSERLKGRYTASIPEDVEDVIIEVFVSYIEEPEQYQPERGRTLAGYLQMAAEGDIKNILNSARHLRTESLGEAIDGQEPVDVGGAGRNSTVEDPVAAAVVEGEASRRLHQLASAALPDPTDQSLLQMILDGERETTGYAQVLGVAHLPVDEQRATVKRNTDRIKKVLRRLATRAKGLIE